MEAAGEALFHIHPSPLKGRRDRDKISCIAKVQIVHVTRNHHKSTPFPAPSYHSTAARDKAKQEEQNINIYNITATREDGTTFTDRVTAATPGEARKDFKDIYRHGKPYTITDTELLADDVPATKDHERKALEQIKAILATLGPNSYVATALDGYLEDAERNIEDDAAYSMKFCLESADLEIIALKV